MWILGGEAEEESTDASMKKVASLIAEQGGELLGAEVWGRRTLSYPIKDNSEGVYCLAYFKAAPAAISPMERALFADQQVIRHLFVRHDRPLRPEGEPAGRHRRDRRSRSSSRR